jgi:pimeloyl-ACP methyl ester carboxylesterase
VLLKIPECILEGDPVVLVLVPARDSDALPVVGGFAAVPVIVVPVDAVGWLDQVVVVEDDFAAIRVEMLFDDDVRLRNSRSAPWGIRYAPFGPAGWTAMSSRLSIQARIASSGRLPRMRAVRARDGTDIAYLVDGQGPPVVLLHGATSDGRHTWAAETPALARLHRVLAPDARGHGRSGWDPATGITWDLLVDDVAAFVDALGLETFHLAGFSMGAATALLYATRAPERLRSLLVAGTSLVDEPRRSVAKRLLDPDRIERDEPTFAAELAARHGPAHGEGHWQALLRALIAGTADPPRIAAADLRGITVPAIVAVGDADPFCPVEQAARLKRQLPSAGLFVSPGCGHELHAARPGLFIDVALALFRAGEAGLAPGGSAPDPSPGG